MKRRGVYGIEHAQSRRLYVGMTYRSFWVRWQFHITQLDRGTHINEALQSDWMAFGSAAFCFRILHLASEHATEDDVVLLERRTIVELSLSQSLYNAVCVPRPNRPVIHVESVGPELTTGEAARMAGVSIQTIHNWIDGSKLPAREEYQGGRRIRYVMRSALDTYLATLPGSDPNA